MQNRSLIKLTNHKILGGAINCFHHAPPIRRTPLPLSSPPEGGEGGVRGRTRGEKES
jgi:hypothetical protein